MADSIANININQIMSNYSSKINLNSFTNQNVFDYSNINKLDNFSASLDDSASSTMLKGAISKIQEGQNLQENDFIGMTREDFQFAKDLDVLTAGSQKIKGVEQIAGKFSNLLDNYLNNVNNTSKEAEKAVETFASGGNIDIHSVMIASEKASLSMNLAMQMRNKIIQAYTEIKNIRV